MVKTPDLPSAGHVLESCIRAVLVDQPFVWQCCGQMTKIQPVGSASFVLTVAFPNSQWAYHVGRCDSTHPTLKCSWLSLILKSFFLGSNW
jgi:hypothetical protein